MTIRRVAMALPVVLAGWVALMALVMVTTGAAPGAVVILPSDRLLANLPDGAAITAHSRFGLTLTSKAPGLGRDLYAAGAWLVLPAGLTGCLPLPKSVRPA